MELDPERMLIELSEGKQLDPDALAEMVSCLESIDAVALGRLPSVDQVYSYLVVLGKLGNREYRRILERYLEAEDCLTVSLILDTLCTDWGLTDEYLEHVLKFALRVTWDEDSDVQESAIKILGEYLAENFDPSQPAKMKHYRVLELLYSIFLDDTAGDYTRQVAYCALLRSMQVPLEQLPGECTILELSEDSTDLDQEVLARCREILSEPPRESPPAGKRDRG